MPMIATFLLQSHRGARGLKPENTLPGFEVAFDLGVTGMETDIHLTRDGVPVLFHDPTVSERLCRLLPGSSVPAPETRPAVSGLTLAELRGYIADRNPDPHSFPDQDATVTPVAARFAEQLGLHPYAVPTLADLFAFAGAYAEELGAAAGKTSEQRERVRTRLRFELELKLVPFRPQASDVVERMVEVVRQAGMVERTGVCCFDHRSLRRVRQLEVRITTAALAANTAPVAPADLVRQAEADAYGPDFEFLDEEQVRQCHAQGVRVVPWTVNDPADMQRLLDWGVDGITTDFPDRLASVLRTRGVAF